MEQKMNIYQKIQAVAEEVRNVEKNLNVGTGQSSYKAVADIDVLMKVKEAEKKFGLVSIPVKQELVKSEILRTVGQGGYEKINYVDVVKMTLRIINIENPDETVEVESFGRGLDAGDKGFGKASTYARKYALLNAYKIATGQDPDEQKSEQQVALSQNDVRDKVMDYLMQNVQYTQSVLSYYSLGSTDDLGTKEINSIYKNLRTKGLLS
jgi:hypothetical protein